MGKLVNKNELSEIFYLSGRSLSRWQKKGLTFIQSQRRGQPNEYDTKVVHDWLNSKAISGHFDDSDNIDTEQERGRTKDYLGLFLQRSKIDKSRLHLHLVAPYIHSDKTKRLQPAKVTALFYFMVPKGRLELPRQY